MKQIRPSDLLTTAMRRAMFAQERVRSGRVLGPIGNKRLVVFNETCNQPRKVSTSTPNTSSVPGSRVPVLGVQGGSGLVAIESTIRGESAGSEFQQSVVPAGLPSSATPLLALKVTDFSGGNITFDIAAFSGASHVETLFEGVVLPGIKVGASATNARQQLMDARSLVGLTGVPDGSIGIRTFDNSLAPDEATFNIVDIDTGAVASRVYVPGFAPILGGESFPGWDYFADEIYFTATYELRTRLQVSTLPPDLSSQTILADEDLSGSHFAVAFYGSDAIFGEGSSVDVWDRVPYSTGFTEAYVTGSSPGNRLGEHPKALGLADGKYWHVGRADTGAIDTAQRDIKLYTTLGIVDVGANGFIDFGLPSLGAFYQTWNGFRQGQYDFNRDRSAIVGWPIWTTLGPTSPDGVGGVVIIPLTATAWEDAAFIQLDTVPFRADAVIADARGAV